MYLIDSEVRDEINEIIIYLRRNGVQNNEIKVICPTAIADSLDVDIKNICKYSPKDKKLNNKLYQLIILLREVRKGGVRVLFSGYPMLKHRLISIFSLGKIKHFSYIRGLHADAKNFSGFSDFMFKFFKKGPWLIKFNNFQANKIVTIGDMNKDFLLGRSVDSDKIELIEPIWLSNIKRVSDSSIEISKNRKVYFITQAFEKHGYPRAQKSQEEMVQKLKARFDDFKMYSFIVRVHPRDDTGSYHGCDVDSTLYNIFLENLNVNDIVISPFSTMAFEITYLGGEVIFYSTDILDEFYSDVYSRLDISPFRKVDDIIDYIKSNHEHSIHPYNNVVSYVFYSNPK